MFLFGLILSQNVGTVICLSPLNILKKRMFPHRPLVFTHEGHQGTGRGTGRRGPASLLGSPGAPTPLLPADSQGALGPHQDRHRDTLCRTFQSFTVFPIQCLNLFEYKAASPVQAPLLPVLSGHP